MAVNSFADKLVKKIFGSSSDIFLKKTHPVVEQINALEPTIEKLSDEELKAQTPKFKERIKSALAEFDKSPRATNRMDRFGADTEFPRRKKHSSIAGA
jgi:preprotein translocase subunit SecA